MEKLLAALMMGLFSIASFAMHHESEASQKTESHEMPKKGKHAKYKNMPGMPSLSVNKRLQAKK